MTDAYTYSIIDGDMDSGTFSLDVNQITRVWAPVNIRPGMALGGVMAIRAWHTDNYQKVCDFCQERNIKLVHVYDNVRRAVEPGDVLERFGGQYIKALVVEFECTKDAMLFKLSWPIT